MADKFKSNPEQSYRRARRRKQLDSAAAGATDPFFERNEFKPGFYDQKDRPPVSYETLKGTAAKPIPNVTDTESFKEGGFARGQKAIQVKKVPFRGVF
jgi:hypothetical protein